jgi:hypothetical protein
VPELPLPPFARPRLALFLVIQRHVASHPLNLVIVSVPKNAGSLSGKIVHKAYSFIGANV